MKGDKPRRSRWLRAAALGIGGGSAAVYGYGVVKYRHTAARRFSMSDPPAPGTPEFSTLIELLTGGPVRPGNQVEVLRNGCRTFPSMLAAIASATNTIDFSSYIYWPGEVTSQFSDAFMERAAAGVEVNMVLDAWGSAKLDREHLERLRRAGVNVCFFRAPHWYSIHKLNNRMHRRLLIVDGKVGFAGGVGIADVWAGDAQDPEHWRETHVRLEGPAVLDVLGGFIDNWAEATGQLLGAHHFPELRSFDDGVAVQVTRSSPGTGGTAAAQLFYAAIAGARQRLWLTTAYFAASGAFVDGLCDAARRGVDVRVLTNGPCIDKEIVRQTGRRLYGPLLEAGVRIFEYQQTMLHAKVLVVDGAWANVGSANFDHRSLALDVELNVAFDDAGLCAEFEKHFLDDMEVSKEIDLDQWNDRSLVERAIEYAGEMARQSF